MPPAGGALLSQAGSVPLSLGAARPALQADIWSNMQYTYDPLFLYPLGSLLADALRDVYYQAAGLVPKGAWFVARVRCGAPCWLQRYTAGPRPGGPASASCQESV